MLLHNLTYRYDKSERYGEEALHKMAKGVIPKGTEKRHITAFYTAVVKKMNEKLPWDMTWCPKTAEVHAMASQSFIALHSSSQYDYRDHVYTHECDLHFPTFFNDTLQETIEEVAEDFHWHGEPRPNEGALTSEFDVSDFLSGSSIFRGADEPDFLVAEPEEKMPDKEDE